ncbi:hypothetical protein CAP47_06780 [Psychroflexus sp. S27]|uniref:glycosyltransferase n=1 Tax=Psychroflexus sp. S27 TaxID=1982757 RepID=UPI000C29BC00|nr:glycosyltransferase [Psychroflexus sp. S27]PJX22729.1 hypothetical protein CAP47_06780 [Psychroflexus sp. S27]
MRKLNILVAPLHWGLGHATRCIPIIRKLISEGHHIVIASDGKALDLLNKEFTELKSYRFQSSEIIYGAGKTNMKFRLFKASFKMLLGIKREKRITNEICDAEKIDFIISDNRLGVRNKTIKSVIISHQLNLKHHFSAWLPHVVYRSFLNKFDQIWVPDQRGGNKLSGRLSQWKKAEHKTYYIGLCSALEKKETPSTYEFCILLSGPEPQRGLLEEKLIAIFKSKKEKSIMIGGRFENEQKTYKYHQLTYINYMTSQELSNALNASSYIICRSGYSSLMDLTHLHKKGILIPTPEQPEQIYLAKYLKKKGIFDYKNQKDIEATDFMSMDQKYTGFQKLNSEDTKLILPDISLK